MSVFVSFEVFVRPAILRMMGRAQLSRPEVTATLSADVEGPGGKMQYARVEVVRGADGWTATPTGARGSNLISTIARANGLAMIPPGTSAADGRARRSASCCSARRRTDVAAEPSSGQARHDGVTRIVEVGAKPETSREATAEAWLVTTPEAVAQLVAGTSKGSPLESAKLAGITGVKRTPELLPHCHPIRVTGADVTIEPDGRAGQDPGRRDGPSDRPDGRRDGSPHGRSGRRAVAVRHREGVRSQRADRRGPSAGEVRRHERRLRRPVGRRLVTASDPTDRDRRHPGRGPRPRNESHRCAFGLQHVVLPSGASPDVVSTFPIEQQEARRVEWLALAPLGIMWAAFLAPTPGRRRSAHTSVGDFERGLELLAYSEVHGTQGRWIVTPRKGARFVGTAERQRARARDRRRRVFVVLLESILLTGLIGAVPPLRAMWSVTLVLGVLLVLYVWLLLSMKARSAPPTRRGAVRAVAGAGTGAAGREAASRRRRRDGLGPADVQRARRDRRGRPRARRGEARLGRGVDGPPADGRCRRPAFRGANAMVIAAPCVGAG